MSYKLIKVICISVILLIGIITVILLIKTINVNKPPVTKIDSIVNKSNLIIDSIQHNVVKQQEHIVILKNKLDSVKQVITNDTTTIQNPDYSIDSVRLCIQSAIDNYRKQKLLFR